MLEVDIVRHDNGVLRASPTNARVFMLGCSGYRAMCDLLYEQFQSGAGAILYRMGEGYARKLVAAMPLDIMSREEAVKIFQRLAMLSGWGNIKLKVVDEKTAECTVTDSPFVLYREDVGSTSCYFLSGILSGVASALMGTKFTAVETLCKARGSTCCKFNITQLSGQKPLTEEIQPGSNAIGK
jgi:predicted hydrocarbon binding protein